MLIQAAAPGLHRAGSPAVRSGLAVLRVLALPVPCLRGEFSTWGSDLARSYRGDHSNCFNRPGGCAHSPRSLETTFGIEPRP